MVSAGGDAGDLADFFVEEAWPQLVSEGKYGAHKPKEDWAGLNPLL